MKTNLNAKSAASLGPGEWYDELIPGFGLRVSDRGRRAWTFIYRFEGKSRRLSLGTCPPVTAAQAREAARAAWLEIQQGRDPQTLASTEPGLTFATLAERYLAEGMGKLRASTRQQYERLLRVEILPVFGARDPVEIRKSDVREWSTSLAQVKPVVANRAFAVMQVVWSFALSRDLVEGSPFLGLSKPAVETPRDRVLSDAEVVTVLRALAGERPVIVALWKLLLLTGQRLGSVLAARWSDVDFERGEWRIPITKKARGTESGAGRPHLVPLSTQAVEVLRALQTLSGGEWVFPGGTPRHREASVAEGIKNPQKSAERMRKATGLAFTLHDLRRTAATGMARLRVPVETISRVLDHAVPGESVLTAKTYALHSFIEEKRAALDTWGAHVARLAESARRSDAA